MGIARFIQQDVLHHANRSPKSFYAQALKVSMSNEVENKNVANKSTSVFVQFRSIAGILLIWIAIMLAVGSFEARATYLLAVGMSIFLLLALLGNIRYFDLLEVIEALKVAPKKYRFSISLPILFFALIGARRFLDALEAVIEKQIISQQELAKLKKWAVVWKWIKGEWKRTKNIGHVTTWFDKMHPELSYERRTISKIIRMGEAGELDRFM